MPSFRSAKNQAKKFISKYLKLGNKVKGTVSDTQTISSLGTARTYSSSMSVFAQWLKHQGNNKGIENVSEEMAQSYLFERRECVSQSTLDLDRQAMLLLPLIHRLKRAQQFLQGEV